MQKNTDHKNPKYGHFYFLFTALGSPAFSLLACLTYYTLFNQQKLYKSNKKISSFFVLDVSQEDC